jgi:predicted AAA+ superfamily ATPase
MSERDEFLARAGALLERVEAMLAPPAPRCSPLDVPAVRWRRRGAAAGFEPILHAASVDVGDLLCIDRQRADLDRNTRQFLAGLPANHALLWGPRGTGKSSLVKALFNAHRNAGLRLVEVQRDVLGDLQDICDALAELDGRFLVFCDDLSFEESDPGWRPLKALLDGFAGGPPANVIIYATSNRRHLIPETMQENRDSRIVDGELHLSEGIEEKLALSERFGIWLSFHPFNQEQYLAIVGHWLRRLGAQHAEDERTTVAALQWALQRGSRSGRSAWQFACDWAGGGRLEQRP